MPMHISPLDGRYLKIGRVAQLIADENPTIDYDDIMDMFTRAIFSGAFDPPPAGDLDNKQRTERDKDKHWLQVLIEAPFDRVTEAQSAIKPRPSEYFGAARETILSVMYCDGALPGEKEQWAQFMDLMGSKQEAFATLVRIPFSQYPEKGRNFLADIRAPKEKLQMWFRLREKPIPWFLARPAETVKTIELNGVVANSSQQKIEHANGDALELDGPPARTKRRKQGRPKKPAWIFIQTEIHRLHDEKPKMQKKEIAFEAWRLASKIFEGKELPNIKTIQRKIGEILSN